jgi:hypothetical protein
MRLKFTISDIIDESAKAESAVQSGSIADEIEEEESNVGVLTLTEHTVKFCESTVEDLRGRGINRPGNVVGLKLNGVYSIADQGGEQLSVIALFNWFKIPAQYRETYMRVELSSWYGSGAKYEDIVFEKAFVVSFSEKGSTESGVVEFSIFIRRFVESTAALLPEREGQQRQIKKM